MALLCSVPTIALQLEVSEHAKEQSLLAAWSTTLQDSTKETPIQRVVKLLTEMKEQLEKEAEEDQVQYDKNVCWCETNDKEKTKAISDAESHIEDLEGEIESRAARGAELNVEIEQLGKTIAEETKALADATALREKEYGEFTDSEKDMVQAVTNLKNAILVLGKHHAGLLQLTPAVEQSLGSVLQYAAFKHEEMIAGKAAGLSLLQRSSWARAQRATSSLQTDSAAEEGRLVNMMRNALQNGNEHPSILPAEYASQVLAKAASEGPSFMQQPVAVKSYEPASGQILGILKQMKEEFENNLSQSQKEEIKAQEEYTALKATKEEQIAASKKMKDEKSTEMWANKKALTDAKEDLESTRAQFSADKKFLMDLRLTCQTLDRDYAERMKSRMEEIKAVAETIGILTSDDARDMLSKTVTLLQLQSRRSTAQAHKALRNKAVDILRKAAAELDPFGDGADDLLPMWGGMRPASQLSMLATKVALDAFTKIKEAMDKMIADLKTQQADEVKQKEFCTKELNENEQQTYKTNEVMKDLTVKIENLASTIATLEEEISAAKAEIADTQVELKTASEARKAENQEYQVTVSDQRATQAILKKAKDRMAKFYSFLMTKMEKKVAPPGGMPVADRKKNAGGNVIISFLEQIIEDSLKVENEAIEAEQAAQQAYAEFVNDCDSSIEKLNESIVQKTDNVAVAKSDKENAEMEAETTQGQLDELAAYAADLHKDCDFMLKNFDLRQAARLKEIEAIQEAKAILSGMK